MIYQLPQNYISRLSPSSLRSRTKTIASTCIHAQTSASVNRRSKQQNAHSLRRDLQVCKRGSQQIGRNRRGDRYKVGAVREVFRLRENISDRVQRRRDSGLFVHCKPFQCRWIVLTHKIATTNADCFSVDTIILLEPCCFLSQFTNQSLNSELERDRPVNMWGFDDG